MRRFLPRDSTRVTVRPESAASGTAGTAEAAEITVCPPRTFWSVRAARQIVSPSGIGVRTVAGEARRGRREAFEVAARTGEESRRGQVEREGRLAGIEAVDLPDED